MADSNQVDLLLIGKTGNGKSATGNSILRRKAFQSASSTTAVTSTVQYEVSEFNGRIIKVVDGPGVGDNRMTTEGAVNLVMTTMTYAIAANPRGYHACLLILKFGGRFTAEEQDTIDLLKKIFGHDFVSNFCILILTWGDSFEHDSEETGNSFHEWCSEQGGRFQDLVKECQNRVVLFDNRTTDLEKKNQQIEKLLKVVDNLSSKGQRYTDDNFELAREARNRIVVELDKSVIQEVTMTETSLVLTKLQELQAIVELRSKIEPLEMLQLRIESLIESLFSQDRDTRALQDLILTVKSIKRNVNDEIKFCYRMMDEREKVRRREEEIRQKYENKMKVLEQQHGKKLKKSEKILEENRKFEEEKEKLKAEMEEMAKKEREELEKKYQEEHAKINKENEEAEQLYMKVKEKNDRGIISRIFEGVIWPLRKVKGRISSARK